MIAWFITVPAIRSYSCMFPPFDRTRAWTCHTVNLLCFSTPSGLAVLALSRQKACVVSRESGTYSKSTRWRMRIAVLAPEQTESATALSTDNSNKVRLLVIINYCTRVSVTKFQYCIVNAVKVKHTNSQDNNYILIPQASSANQSHKTTNTPDFIVSPTIETVVCLSIAVL